MSRLPIPQPLILFFGPLVGWARPANLRFDLDFLHIDGSVMATAGAILYAKINTLGRLLHWHSV